jgi:hypothetical protein
MLMTCERGRAKIFAMSVVALLIVSTSSCKTTATIKPEHCTELEELPNARAVAQEGKALLENGEFVLVFDRWDYLEAYCRSINSAWRGE